MYFYIPVIDVGFFSYQNLHLIIFIVLIVFLLVCISLHANCC